MPGFGGLLALKVLKRKKGRAKTSQKMTGIFGEFSVVSVSKETQHKNSSKSLGTIQTKNSEQHSGMQF